MNKFRKTSAIIAFCAASFLLPSCSCKANVKVDNEFREIYNQAVENGYQGTYKEWVDLLILNGSNESSKIKDIEYIKTEDNKAIYKVTFNDKSVVDLEIPLVKGNQGEQGVSIKSIVKTFTLDNVDFYTITYTDGRTTEFKVTNGKDGEQGIQGEPGKDGITPTIAISGDGYWVINGEKTEILAQGHKGDKGDQGEPGRGIQSIDLVSEDGLIDTYKITYTDGKSQYFVVTNGKDGTNGTQGEQGIQGIPGEDGKTPTIEISDDGYWVINGEKSRVLAQGIKGDKGDQGEPGKDGVDGQDGLSITEIKKTETVGNIDTYTIYYSDGTTSKFTVTNGINGENGTDGAQGEQGIQGVPGKDGVTPTIEISKDGYWVINGVQTQIKAEGVKGDKGDQGNPGKDGVDGQDGRSVTEIKKTSTSGNVDTYTILYSDGTTSTFTVTNGTDGIQGEQGIQGVPGKDGVTPTIEISEDGYWVINGARTEIKAQGIKGDKGDQGVQGIPGQDGADGESAYQLYIKTHPEYNDRGEKQWLDDLLNNRLPGMTKHKVTFIVDGQVYATREVTHGEKVQKPISPSKLGHIFTGWECQNEPWSFIGYVVTEDLVLNATWKKEIYTIEIVDEFGLSKTEQFYYNDQIILEQLEKPNMKFLGWFNKDNEPVSSPYIVTGNNKLTPKFTDKIDIYFDTKGGNVIAPMKTKIGAPISYLPTPTRERAYFLGWFINENGVEKEITTSYVVNSTDDIHVYAKWDTEYWKYRAVELSDGTMKLLECNDTELNIVIPTTYKNKKVSTIASTIFDKKTDITSLTISEGITTIEDSAFAKCLKLTKVDFPVSMTNYGNGILPDIFIKNIFIRNNVSLEQLYGKVKSGDKNSPSYNLHIKYDKADEDIGFSSYLLKNWTYNPSIYLEDGFVNISQNYFANTKIETVYLAKTTKTISNKAFYDCTQLKFIRFNEGLETIGERAFVNTWLQGSIDLPKSLKLISNSAFNRCSAINSLYINGATEVGISAFEHCDNMTSLHFDVKVTTVGDKAFNFCNRIERITYSGRTVSDFRKINFGIDNSHAKNESLLTCGVIHTAIVVK